MTVPSGTFQTFQAIGVREDLEDIIYDISPTETPFLTAAKRVKATSTYHEWQTDALTAAGTNATIDGDDATLSTALPTVRLRNYIQYLSKAPSVSEGNEATDSAGRDSEMAYQVMKRGKEMKRDLEYALIRNQSSTAGGAASAPLMASVESWLPSSTAGGNATSVGQGTAQTTPGYSGGTVAAPTDSTSTGTLTEAALKQVIQECWTDGGDPKTLMVGPAVKSKISTGFSGIATRFRDVPSGKQAQIISGVDLYVSDFGEHRLVPNRFMRDQNILVLDMEYWKVAYLIPFTSWDLAKTGASRKKQLYCAATLVAANVAASGKVTDIRPSL